jgi:hypothetical protein
MVVIKMKLDLDAVIAKKRTIRFMGRDVELKEMKTEDYLRSQAILEDMGDLEEGLDLVKHMADKIKTYVLMVLDVTEEEAEGMEYRQFRALKEYMARLDLLDQGFTEKEIEIMEKRVTKNRVERALSGSLPQDL